MFSFPFPLLPLKYKTKSTPAPRPDLKIHTLVPSAHAERRPLRPIYGNQEGDTEQHPEHTLPRNTDRHPTPRPLLAHKGSYLSTEARAILGTAQPGQRESLSDRSIVPSEGRAGGERAPFLNSRARSLCSWFTLSSCYGPTPFLRRLLEVGQVSTPRGLSGSPAACFQSLGSIQARQRRTGRVEGPAWLWPPPG